MVIYKQNLIFGSHVIFKKRDGTLLQLGYFFDKRGLLEQGCFKGRQLVYNFEVLLKPNNFLSFHKHQMTIRDESVVPNQIRTRTARYVLKRGGTASDCSIGEFEENDGETFELHLVKGVNVQSHRFILFKQHCDRMNKEAKKIMINDNGDFKVYVLR